MKKILFAIIVIAHLSLAANWSVYFSPKGGCQQALIDHINASEKEILVQSYSFTSEPIAIALVDAKKRGCNVMVIIDKTVFDQSVYPRLKKGKVKVFEDGKHSLAHAKIMIFDKTTVAMGSFNFTGNAENNNSEDLNFLIDPAFAKKYIENFNNHLEHSEAK